VTNLNIDPGIIRFTREVFIPETGKGIEADGFRFHRYIVGEPFEEEVVRYSTTSINDGRQSMGIYNTLSFIFEGKRYGNLTNEIEKRTRGQVSAIINFLDTAGRNAGQVLAVVNQARQEMAQQDQSYLQMDYFFDPDRPTLKFPVFDLETWSHTYRELPFYKPLVRVKKSVTKPAAYVFDASQTNLVELLKRHRLPIRVLQNDQQVKIETYVIKHVTDAIEEEKPALAIDLDKTASVETLPAGTVVVPVSGPASNLVPLMLEPDSTWSIVTARTMHQHRFGEFLAAGRPYPVKRLATLEGLAMETLEY
jgi:hypothetical protein